MNVLTGKAIVRHNCLQLIVLGYLLGAGAICQAEQSVDADGIATLAKLEYKREVLMYCGISDREAVRGFLDRQAQLIERHALTDAMKLQAASDARQAAYAEWQNRGLGGFRGWCRKEGADYTAILKSYVIDSGVQNADPESAAN